jgi:multiple sugar transport system permease protein
MTNYQFSASQTLRHITLILGSLIVILPFYVMVSYSLKSPGEIERNEGGFFGTQAPMVDERCVKRREPDQAAIKAGGHLFQPLVIEKFTKG